MNVLLAGQDFFFLSSFENAYRKASALAAERSDKTGEDRFMSLAAAVVQEQKLHQVRNHFTLRQQ